MSVVEPQQTCPACENAVTPEAAFCKTCGGPLQPTVRPSPPRSTRWYHNIWFVLFMLFFVIGPFGLPLVWSNPKFSRGVKIGLSIAMVLYTIALVDLTIRAFTFIMNEAAQLNSILQP